MIRKRLRPAHSPEQLRRIYAKPHNHRRWRDHHLRVDVTTQVANWMAGHGGGEAVGSAADLSCGNAAILKAIPAGVLYLGDIASGYEFTGPIEETIHQIPDVDLFVCSETVEHLDDPDMVLAAIRSKTRMLVLSTPVEAWDDDNAEHYWAWSREGVEEMLTRAGFASVVYTTVDFRPMRLPYCFGIWGAR